MYFKSFMYNPEIKVSKPNLSSAAGLDRDKEQMRVSL